MRSRNTEQRLRKLSNSAAGIDAPHASLSAIDASKCEKSPPVFAP